MACRAGAGLELAGVFEPNALRLTDGWKHVYRNDYVDVYAVRVRNPFKNYYPDDYGHACRNDGLSRGYDGRLSHVCVSRQRSGVLLGR